MEDRNLIREFLSTVYIVKDGKVLLTFNSKVNKFIPLGGHIEANELPCDAVIREAKEESGYDIELIDFGDLKIKNLPQNLDIQLDIIKSDHHHINISYVGKIIGGELLSESDEGTELKWFSPEEIINHTGIFDNTKEKALKAIEIMEIARGPKQGEKYKHFKDEDKIYEIIAVARDSDNPEKKLVIYKALYSKESFPLGTIWSREINEFMGYKELPNGTKVKRYTLIR
jgi:ADP-ribose pyrophosphatase YjhB (NUDIX family)